ncbi:MAG: DEAD/DEAH box helicase [Trebonia sp.]
MSFWRVLEMIEPREIPRATRAREKREPGTDFVEAIELRPGEPVPPLPWQEGHRRFDERPTQSRYGSVWRHTVYGGVFKFQAVRAELARELRFELGEDHAGVHQEESALFAFVVDAQGRLVDGTGAFSSCAWGAGRFRRLRKGDPGAFDGFETAADKCEQALFRLLSSHVSYPTRLAARLRTATAATAATARPGGKFDAKRYWGALLVDIVGGAAGGAVTTAIGGLGAVLGGPVGAAAAAGAANTAVTKVTERAKRAVTGEQPEEPPPGQQTGAGDPRAVQALDIVVLANAIAGHLGLPPDLLNVLEFRVESKPVFRRKDGSLPDPETAFLSSMIAPDLKRVADARDRGYGPALSSYLSGPLPNAKRIDLREEGNRYLLTEGTSPDGFPSGRWPADLDRALVISQQFAVNTIIRDKGTAMFAVNGPPGTGKTTLLRDLIAAIVVSRATELAALKSPKDAFVNRAVIERADGMMASLRGPRDELTGFEIVVASSNNAAVENITKELPALKAIGEEWQEIAGYFRDQASAFLNQPDGNDRSGKKKPKKAPAQAWGLLAVPLGNAANRRRFNDWFRWDSDGMYRHLTRLAINKPPTQDWAGAKQRFLDALASERKLAGNREAAYRACFDPVDDTALCDAQKAAHDADTALARAQAAHRGLRRQLEQLKDLHAALREKSHVQVEAKPGRAARLLAREHVRQWRQEADALATESDKLEASVRSVRAKVRAAGAAVTEAAARATKARERRDELAQRRQEDAKRREGARRDWPHAYPDTWHRDTQADQERAAPWSDEKWMQARTEVFLAALDLHRACIEANAGEVRDTLVELCRLLTRDPGRTTVKEAERAAWQTLFFLIPVLSSTFASTGRMFGHLGKEDLGWLLIDEAGQALPQAAVGALWRSKRAVVVGDPRQLEPISQLPGQVQRELANSFGIAADFIPAGRSAQALADRRSRLGTSVHTDADPVWVGMPLRVHRRCETPMFEMSNELAYGGLMVYGTTPKRLPAVGEECPPSSWYNVHPHTVSGRWVDEQGKALGRTLTRLLTRYGVPLEQIYVLSPFRVVVRECRTVARNSLRAAFEHAPDGLDEFLDKHIGTVHRMQGKEADVVILVLGTDQTPGRRARDWVGAPPNLLNVAVSRARRRLYVIGSYPEWLPAPNFGVFATTDTFPKYDFFALW